MNQEDKRILVRKSFILDMNNEERNSFIFLSGNDPEEFVTNVSNRNPEKIWGSIPNWINENLDWDNGIEDVEDAYRWDFEDETAIYIGNLTYYFDKNQWKFLDKNYRPDPNHGHNWDMESLRVELVVEYSNIFGDSDVSEINISFNIDGNCEEYQVYPKCKMPQYMTKKQIKNFLGSED